MHAIIFAAGRGTRMGALVTDRPKPLIEVAGKPILLRTLEAMPEAIDHIIIVVGHLQAAIREADGIKGREDITLVEQPDLTGTYDALIAAKPFLPDAPFLAMNGDDVYAKEGLATLAASVPYSVMVKSVIRPNRYSHVETKGGVLTRIVPNAALPDEASLPMTRTYTGAALLDPSFFDLEPAMIPLANHVPGAGEERSLPHTLERYRDTRPVRVVEGPLWLPIGTPDELKAAEACLRTLDTSSGFC